MSYIYLDSKRYLTWGFVGMWQIGHQPMQPSRLLLQLLVDTTKTKLCTGCRDQPLGSAGAVAMLVDWEAAEDSATPKFSAIFWPAHMAFSVWKTACGATFIFSRSTMILVGMTRDKWGKKKAIDGSPNSRYGFQVLRLYVVAEPQCLITDLKTSWSTVIPAACVNSNSSASSAVRIFFFFMAYFWTLVVTTSAGDPGAEAARCVGWDILDRILLRLIRHK